MPFLIFTTYEDAVARNEEAGNAAGLAYHQGTGSTRYVWGIDVEDSNDPRAALVIDRRENLLNDYEIEALEESLPDDWQLHPEP
mgnify:FL=1|tara:strand:+ start:97 stop:348 length:252 start_codon:yes stop_codon:yes gene_type:complete